MILTVAEYARKVGISRSAAYLRIRDHSIPMVSKGRIDFEVAERIWAESKNLSNQIGARAEQAVHGKIPGEADIEDAPIFTGEPIQERETIRPGAQMSDRARASYALDLLKIREKKLLVEQLEGKLVNREDVYMFESQMISTVKSTLLIIGAEIADRLARTNDPVECRQIVDDRIEQALVDLSNWKPDRSE